MFGWSQSDESAAKLSLKVDEIRARERAPEKVQEEALARDHNYEATEDFFSEALLKDLAEYSLTGVDLESLRQPNAFFHLVSEPKILAPGKSFSSPQLKVSAKIEPVKYRRAGATVSAKHAIARVINVSDSPLGYFIDVRSSDRGECKVRGTRTHNLMALQPGQHADIAVCAGSGGIEILDLRALVVSPVGAVYLSKLPPLAAGYDAVSARAHAPGRKVSTCSQVAGTKLSRLIRAGEVEWQDIADFYSRHNCERLQFPVAYKHATKALEKLPFGQ